MKKRVFLAFILCAIACIPAFGQETYTLLVGGNKGQGTITVAQDRGGKITVTGKTPAGALLPDMEITHALCPLIPAGEVVGFGSFYSSVIIDGNTTTTTYRDGDWFTTVVSGNTKATTHSDGSWSRTVVNGNTTTTTYPGGRTWKTVVNGNTTTYYSDEFLAHTDVVNGNTTTRTFPNGQWKQTVVDRQGYTIFITVTWGYPNR
jgi:hypothetical protein